MSEIKHSIDYISMECINGQQIEGYLIDERGTIADIARWIVENDWHEEMVYLLNNREEL
jgi:hypothetical protein